MPNSLTGWSIIKTIFRTGGSNMIPISGITCKLSPDCSWKRIVCMNHECACVGGRKDGEGAPTGANNHIWSQMIGIRCWQQFLAVVGEYYSSPRFWTLIISHCEVVSRFSTVRLSENILQVKASLYPNVSVKNDMLQISLKTAYSKVHGKAKMIGWSSTCLINS